MCALKVHCLLYQLNAVIFIGDIQLGLNLQGKRIVNNSRQTQQPYISY